MKIIAIGHYRRVGKDTFANFLKDELHRLNPNLRVAKLPWAGKLKDVCHQLYGWAGLRELEFYETEPGASQREVVLPLLGKSPRQIWVDMGTAAVREKVYDRTWLDYLIKSDLQLDVLLVPDTRFFNEAYTVLDAGGELLKIVRPGYGPGNNIPDRQLLGFDRFSNIFGETGDILELQRWANRYAAWLCGGEKPTRSREEMNEALKVEVIEPWTPPEIVPLGLAESVEWYRQATIPERWTFLEEIGGECYPRVSLAYVDPRENGLAA